MTFNPEKGQMALRHGRDSMPHAEYFLTLCTEKRGAGLDECQVGQCVIDEMRAMEADGTWIIRCATLMPDHLHLLIVLGSRLSLGQTVQRLKARTAIALRKGALKWQHNFFDRRLRMNDDHRLILFYIYLNPYRKNLCPSTQSWPWFICGKDDWLWLQAHLGDQPAPPEWLT